MTVFELLFLGLGLSMDAMAVSICKGLSVKRMNLRSLCTAGLYFGGFQALMPLLGYLLGSSFQDYVEAWDHWIAFFLLGFIGINMIKESRQSAENLDPDFSPGAMLPLAVATSIDAMAVGITFAFLGVEILPAISLIGLTTFCLSSVGVYIGHTIGAKCKGKAELLGGLVLIGIGAKLLLDQLDLWGRYFT